MFPSRDLAVKVAYAVTMAMAMGFLLLMIVMTAARASADGDGTPPGVLIDPGWLAPNTTTVEKPHPPRAYDARLWLVDGNGYNRPPYEPLPPHGRDLGPPVLPPDVDRYGVEPLPPGYFIPPGVPKPGPYGDGYGPTTPPPQYCVPPCYPAPWQFQPWPPNDGYGYFTPPPADFPGPFGFGRRGFYFDFGW